MASLKAEPVNPLRPYYRPPTIEQQAEPVSIPSSNPFSGGNSYDVASGAKYASKAKHMLNDLDYKGLVGEPSPSVVESARELVDELIWKYMSVLIGQPFEVAKMILQARDQDEKAAFAVVAEPEATPAPHVSSRAGSAFDVSALSQSLLANALRCLLRRNCNRRIPTGTSRHTSRPTIQPYRIPGIRTSPSLRSDPAVGAQSRLLCSLQQH